ncbi:alpha/beta hydrolase [Sediminispirochaeta bajacaliforniensis]|uniref:alpha/beta hydrolase n=1 Tax=Sediminispirochaeta bajacaliforniensis TaxID=148 RepID=UPI0003790739|nr:alpha/beta fold hydrolase [Sediminispirochaeta bajacaliforniensis]
MKYKQLSFKTGYKLYIDEVGGFNFQLNRWVTTGFASQEEIESIAGDIEGFGTWQSRFLHLAKTAEHEKRLLHAAIYYRAVDFFAEAGTAQKADAYHSFLNLFSEAMKDQDIERIEVPYESAFLPLLRLRPEGRAKGTILIHGGYDSYKEELYPMASYLANRGYEIVLFDGPGQGESLHRYELTLTPDWHYPVSAIIDHLGLDDVTVVGISLGGCLALRAAAFEKRITRVVALDHFYDWGRCMAKKKNDPYHSSILAYALLRVMLCFPRSFDRRLLKKLETNYKAAWVFNQGCHITGSKSPHAYFEAIMRYSTKPINRLITQDVLILAGEEDHAVPVDLYPKQLRALNNAASVEGRLFTVKEGGAQHCQIGNLPLVLDYILEWTMRKT